VLRDLAEEHGLCQAVLGLETAKSGRPCFAHQIRKCKGACIGKEPLSTHSGRLMAALARLRIRPWPFPGPALLREGGEAHVIDRWRYLGTARDEGEVWPLLESGRPDFDHDTYKILLKSEQRLLPIVRP